MATIVEPVADRRASERKFYSRMAIFLVVVVFLGFAPSFYLRGIVPEYPRPNPTLPPSVIFHGLMFTLWMALLVLQTQLIATRRTETHMKLGKATVLVAIALLPGCPPFVAAGPTGCGQRTVPRCPRWHPAGPLRPYLALSSGVHERRGRELPSRERRAKLVERLRAIYRQRAELRRAARLEACPAHREGKMPRAVGRDNHAV